MKKMRHDLGRQLLTQFLEISRSSVRSLITKLKSVRDQKRDVPLFYFKNGRKIEYFLNNPLFLIRSSIEYSTPQLTLEEIQGIIAARLLEVCGRYFSFNDLTKVDSNDLKALSEMLQKPPSNKIVPFLLNCDDVEPDRYSMNPFRKSIISSGQSAFPVASVTLEELKIDQNFFNKFKGSLLCDYDLEVINRHLNSSDNNYLDFIDAVKYEQLEKFSEVFGINLEIGAVRMPLTRLRCEKKNGRLHELIRESHQSIDMIQKLYNGMGRSIKKRKTLLTVPFSKKGYGSKRAARGKLFFQNSKLEKIKVKYKPTALYPNSIDPKDVSFAIGEDSFSIDGKKFENYKFNQTPSAPQFVLYSLLVPENVVIWHGIGVYAASQLVKSYTTFHQRYERGELLSKKNEIEFNSRKSVPLQLNLSPESMWKHPKYNNIDASLACIHDLEKIFKLGMKVEILPTREFIWSKSDK